ncbi:MAG TPA: hypothetical protein DET40_16705 [Lentisphaeria bacterium]|nr:MAG: hypothetical protein A2X45_13040 [Lentisphaerae bacterium GWF2_50_93]HCE45181.1 hypothetical protein [Lentisphaeria bacterium]
MKMMHKTCVICLYAGMSILPFTGAVADEVPTILTENVVNLQETISPEGFVHPGISCNAETLRIMREKVIAGVSPWVDYFEGMRRTQFANLNKRPRLVSQITNDGGIGAFSQDAHLAWAHTILYIVTGNEEYRKTPVEIIKWYGSRTEESFFPQYFNDSHIKIGKYVYTMCSAVDILRATTPKDEKLAVTQEMVDALQKYCIYPIRKNSIERNDYFMNQHTYAIMGYLASTILGDEVEDYKQAVEWTTVNATTPNWGRSGDIKNQIRLVTRNDKTGEAVEPNLQLVEMGRDMPHAEGNLTNLLMMSKTIDFQKTKVDPVAGTVTGKADGVSPINFLDNRLPKGAALFAKYNLGYDLTWVPTYTETDPKHGDYLARFDQPSWRGGGGGNGTANSYHYFKAVGIDMESGPLHYIKAAFDATAVGREHGARSGSHFDSVHNYGFDFWIGLPAAASDAAPDPEKAKRALAVVLPPLEVTRDGVPVTGRQFEYSFVDLSAHAMPGDIYPGSTNDIPLKVQADADGTRYVRMALEKNPRTMVMLTWFPGGAGLRVRSDSVVKLNFGRETIYLPNTNGEWKYVTSDFGNRGVLYIQATPMDGAATIDFDRIDTEANQVLPLSFDVAEDSISFPTYAGAAIAKTYAATTPDKYLFGGATWAPGKVGDALILRSNGQYAQLKDGIVGDLDDFSISAWIMPNKLDPFARVFDFGDSRENYMFMTPTDGKVLKFAIRIPGGQEQAVLGKEPIKTGSWQHVVLTLSGNTGILYVDGKEVGRNSNITLKPSSLGKTQQNYLGKSQWPDPYLAGMVDDFTIFNKALSADEIEKIYTSNQRIDSKASAVRYKFDRQSIESDKEKIEYTARNLPAGAVLDGTSGKFTWTPSVNQAGDHTLYITAHTPVSLRTMRVDIHVAKDLQAALDYVARVYDPKEKYESATLKAFKAALQTKDLATVRKAADQLALLNPKLADGTLDYRMASTGPERGIKQMADGDPLSWGGLWGFDKNVTMDFGNHFKVKANAFRIQCRDGFPIRVAESVVYGSNDRKQWTLLTENKAKASGDLQTLTVKKEELDKAYRYLRLFMPAKPFPIFEIGEFRILGERIEDYSPDYHVAYIKGYDDSTFRPDQKLTKAEAVSLLAGLVDDYTDRGAYTCGFVDVPKDALYYDDVAYMSSKGIGHGFTQPVKYVNGDAENRFHPQALISRGELAGIMSRMQWLKGDDGPVLKDVTTDTPNAAEIRRVAREGWLTADEAGSFRPDAPVTRAEFVVAANKMLQRHCVGEIPSAQAFKDVDKSHRAYTDIMEATATHPDQGEKDGDNGK